MDKVLITLGEIYDGQHSLDFVGLLRRFGVDWT